MKRKLIMITAATLTMTIGVITTVIPAFANSDINSSGNMILEDGNVAFYAEDIEGLGTQVEMLSEGLSEASYVSEGKEAIRNKLNSKGIINYDSGKVIFDSSDLVKLADGIDSLDNGYKYEAVKALNGIHTYLKADGTITHNETDGVISPESASKLNIRQICDGIMKSQSVEHLAEQNIFAASENNISEGYAAWVDGNLIIGSGNDNKDNYNKGYEEGKASKPDVVCYNLGVTTSTGDNGRRYYDIKELLPEVDYTKLTRDNFILCPCKVNTKTSKSTKYLSTASNVTSYCTIYETEFTFNTYYNADKGRLEISPMTISAKGGLSSGGYANTAEAMLDVCTYLIIGDMATP